MLEIRHNGKDFDLEKVDSAISWAHERSLREDEGYAARNCSEQVHKSPLTRELEAARSILLELRLTEHKWTGDRSDDPAFVDA